jgi:flagellar biogenesis protein FliO
MAKTKKQLKPKKSENFFSQIKWGESYTSLFLGALVVIIAIVLVFSFLKDRNNMLKQTSSTSTENAQALELKSKLYTVKVGDDLFQNTKR